MIKCYKCHKEIEDGFTHCPNCGALLKPTQKLLDAIKSNNQEAIKQLYEMTYNTIDYHIRTTGIDESISKTLINKAFIALIKDLPQLPSLDGFSMMLEGVCDHIAYTYLNDHNLEVHEKQVEYRTYDVTDDMIDTLYHEIGLIKDNKAKLKLLLGLLVVVLVIAGAGGYAGYRYQHALIKQKRVEQLKAYIDFGDYYANTVSQRDTSNFVYHKNLWPQVLSAARITTQQYSYDSADVSLKNMEPLLQCEYDLDGDGSNEFITGVQSKGKMLITGLYKYDQDTKSVKQLPLQWKNEYQWIVSITLFKKNQFLIKYEDVNSQKKTGAKEYGILYAYRNHHIHIVKKGITDPDKYIKENKDQIKLLKGHLFDALTKEYNKLTNKHRYTIVNRRVYEDGMIDSYDLDGDGKKDKLSIPYVKKVNNNAGGVDYNFTINDKHYSDIFFMNGEVYNNDAYILRSENGTYFIVLTVSGKNGQRPWSAYCYRHGQLEYVNIIRSKNESTTQETFQGLLSLTVKNNQLIVKENINGKLVPHYGMDTRFKIKSKKLVKVNEPHPITKVDSYSDSNSFIYTNTKGYDVKTNKAFKIYKDVNCSKKGITIPDNKKVLITKVIIGKETNIYQLSYHNKIGYMKTDPSLKFKKQKDGYSYCNKYFKDLH